MELYPQVLGAGDILLAMVGDEAASFSVPSKILSYLAAGKPIVASIARDNDAAATIRAAKAGYIVQPDDSQTFAAKVFTVAADQALRERFGGNARAFAETAFAIDVIADRFEEVFKKIVHGKDFDSKLEIPTGVAATGIGADADEITAE